jgi:hypothetical protein
MINNHIILNDNLYEKYKNDLIEDILDDLSSKCEDYIDDLKDGFFDDNLADLMGIPSDEELSEDDLDRDQLMTVSMIESFFDRQLIIDFLLQHDFKVSSINFSYDSLNKYLSQKFIENNPKKNYKTSLKSKKSFSPN